MQRGRTKSSEVRERDWPEKQRALGWVGQASTPPPTGTTRDGQGSDTTLSQSESHVNYGALLGLNSSSTDPSNRMVRPKRVPVQNWLSKQQSRRQHSQEILL